MSQASSKPNQNQPPLSQAFLLRCWQRDGVWHFMLEDVQTRERRVFVDVAKMVAWLTAVLTSSTSANSDIGQKPKG